MSEPSTTTDDDTTPAGLASGPATTEDADAPDATDEAPATDEASAAGEDEPTWHPGRAVLLAVIAVGWLAVQLWVAYTAIVDDPTSSSLAAVEAALALPGVIVASVVAGAAAGVVVLGRLRSVEQASIRLTASATVGLVVGVLGAAAVLLAYGTQSFMLTVAVTVGASAVLGGLFAAVRPAVAVAAGLAGTLACVALGVVNGYFDSDLTRLVGVDGSDPDAYVRASGWLQLTFSLVSGVLAATVPYAYLRRSGLTLPWPAYLLAGAAPGALLISAEFAVRVGGAQLLRAAGAGSTLDTAMFASAQDNRLIHGMFVFFIGAILSIVLVGRTLRRTE